MATSAMTLTMAEQLVPDEVWDAYDPDDLFHHDDNIPPTGTDRSPNGRHLRGIITPPTSPSTV
jgi:hypothetical protein